MTSIPIVSDSNNSQNRQHLQVQFKPESIMITSDQHCVLIVDNNPYSVRELETILEELKLEILAATSCQEALSVLSSQPVTLVLLDQKTVESNKDGIAEQLENHLQRNGIPVIVITHSEAQPSQFFQETELVDYLYRPIQPAIVQAKIDLFLRLGCLDAKLKKANLQLSDQYRATLAIVNAIPDLLVHLDRQSKVLNILAGNPIEIDLLFTNGLNRTVCEIFSAEIAGKFEQAIHDAIESRSEPFEFRFESIDRIIEYEVRVSRVNSNEVIAVLRDITEKKATERLLKKTQETLEAKIEERTADLKQAKEEAEKANRVKSDFLTNISHELRTPLHGILSFAELGINRHMDLARDKVRHYFSRIHESGSRLMVLLNDLLDLSKLEMGRVDYQMREENLYQIIHSGIDEFLISARTKNIELRLLEPDINTRVVCDGFKIGQVIRNLLSNAIKFTDEGKQISVSIVSGELALDQTTAPGIQVMVKDQGMGIPEQELTTIFDKFIQSSKTKNGAGGTGLGLAICREIILAHKGKIWAENNESGATFRFVLPYRLL